jgi:hypothetical protein
MLAYASPVRLLKNGKQPEIIFEKFPFFIQRTGIFGVKTIFRAEQSAIRSPGRILF